jgi:UDP-glucose 4-epimerase
MVERIFRDYARAYGLRFAALRYFNAAGADPEGEIGESHRPETHLIPLALDAAAGRRKDFKVFGTDYETPDGSCVRDYIHVMDLAKAHYLALEYLKRQGKSGFFNLGNERGTSVIEVIQAVKNVTGKEFAVAYEDRRSGDPAILVGGCGKAKRVLGWEPVYPEIEQIVAHAWNWSQNAQF